jgi:2'-5' RNA ligase
MRLFVAVDLDERVRGAAAACGRDLRDQVESGRRRLAPAGASWVAPQNMHLTLRFLGEVDEERAAQLSRSIAQPFETAPFELALGGLGLFPPAGRPRVLWIGVSEGAAQVAEVYREVERRLDLLGFEREERPFRAHLTLARFREPASIEVRTLVGQGMGAEAGRCLVRDVVLYESRLSPKGPTYNALAHGRLGG